MEALGRPEQLLLAQLLLAAERRARVLVHRRRAAALAGLSPGEDEARPGTRHRHVNEPPRAELVGTRVVVRVRELLLEQRLGDSLGGRGRRPREAPGAEAEHERPFHLERLRRPHRHDPDRAGGSGGRAGCLLVEAHLRQRGRVAGEVAR